MQPVLGAGLINQMTRLPSTPAFSGYARERAAAVGRIVQKADVSGRVMGLSGPAARLRDVVLNIGGPRLMQSWLAEVWAADATLDTAPHRQA